MLEYRKARRRLKQEIKKAEQHSTVRVEDASLDLLPLYTAEGRFQRNHYKMELEILESQHLLDIATTRFGLELSLGKAVYDPKMHGIDPRAYYEAPERAKLRRMISQARFEWWKKWISLLVPILSLLIAIIVLLKK